jgi:DNA-directed RNA polymerase specialized sigma24 family protein
MPLSTLPGGPTADEPDADLLRRIAGGASDPRGARAAQAIFYERHVRYLYGAVLRQRATLLRLVGVSAEDLVQETFHRAFERARTFQPGEGHDPDRARARTRAWLGRIATNLLADHAGAPREIAASPYVERVSCAGIDDEPPPSQSPRARLVAEGLDALSERERDVLRVSALHHRAGEEHQRLPNAVAAELAGRWQTTGDNIRAIRMRAMKKLRAFLASRGAVPEEAS